MLSEEERIEARKQSAEDLWLDYWNKVHPDIPETSVQYRETKLAFYAGLFSLVTWQLKITDDGLEPTAEEEDAMNRMTKEVIAFLQSVADGTEGS